MGVILKGIKKSFKDFNIDVDLTINKGELVTLLGPSGCGKTTTIQLISGILNPDSGDVFITKTFSKSSFEFKFFPTFTSKDIRPYRILFRIVKQCKSKNRY